MENFLACIRIWIHRAMTCWMILIHHHQHLICVLRTCCPLFQLKLWIQLFSAPYLQWLSKNKIPHCTDGNGHSHCSNQQDSRQSSTWATFHSWASLWTSKVHTCKHFSHLHVELYFIFSQAIVNSSNGMRLWRTPINWWATAGRGRYRFKYKLDAKINIEYTYVNFTLNLTNFWTIGEII